MGSTALTHVQTGGGLDWIGGSGVKRSGVNQRHIRLDSVEFNRTVGMKQGGSRMLPGALVWVSWVHGGTIHRGKSRNRFGDYDSFNLPG